MARDYEKAPLSLWDRAEAALGVGYDQVDLTIQTYERARDPVYVQVRPSEKAPKRHQRDYTPTEYSTYGDTSESALDKLEAICREASIRNGFGDLLARMSSEDRQKLKDFARLLLEADHTVILASQGSSKSQVAGNILRSEYLDDVRRHVDSIKDAIEDGEIKTSDDFDEHIHSIEVTYDSDALNTLRFSSNSQEYWEQFGKDAPSWAEIATYAIQAEVRSDLSIHSHQIHTIDCARCGEVTSTEDVKYETDCPKCGLDLEVKLMRGFSQGDIDRCDDCLEQPEDKKGEPIPPDTEFDCETCSGSFLTPPAPKETPKT